MSWNAIASFGPTALRNLNLTSRDFASRLRPAPRGLAEASRHDVYLSPHCDDICFSLGAFTRRRQQGVLLTLFSRSGYVARPGTVAARGDERIAMISTVRQDEEQAFSRRAGLRLCLGGLDEAPLRGHDPFDSAAADEDARRLDAVIIEAIFASTQEQAETPRPWLFCPAGIGGHIDHLVVLKIVLRHYEALRERWRIAFYEDLHYAAVWRTRVAGLARLQALAAPVRLRRWSLPIGSAAEKLALAALYPSQFAQLPASIAALTPALQIPASAHEALWSAEPA